MPIISSLLDTDFYKVSMQQIALHQFPTTNVKYEFKCRNSANWTPEFLDRLNNEIDNYCSLQYSQDELDYLSTIPFFKKDYIDFLSLYKPNRKHINAFLKNGELKIEVNGPWYLTIPFEVPVLAMVNELYFEDKVLSEEAWVEGFFRLNEKVEFAKKNNIPFADFGTRRRLSHVWQDIIVLAFSSNCPTFAGTSNIYFAKKYNLKAIGTMAHEYIMAGAGQDTVPLVKSQAYMLQKWVDEYRGDLGIALTDTYGMDAFLRDFDKYFAKLYDGLRHDSGNPIEWGEKAVAHYQKLKIDPTTKTLVFSDGLTMEKSLEILNHFKDRIKVSFGIGTNLTNDFPEIEPLQIVMKITECNGRPVAKVSDTKGKGMCHDEEYLSYVRKVFKINS